jgi:hypothetical protein
VAPPLLMPASCAGRCQHGCTHDLMHPCYCGCCRLCLSGLCEATLQAEAAARRAATLVYDDAELMVELIAEEELQAAFGTAAAGKQATGFSRNKPKESATLCVSRRARSGPGQQG